MSINKAVILDQKRSLVSTNADIQLDQKRSLVSTNNIDILVHCDIIKTLSKLYNCKVLQTYHDNLKGALMSLDLSRVLAAAGKLNRSESVRNLRLCDISRDESQPRTVFDDQSLLELATDIEQYGLLQPIIVREESEGKYIIIAGERRYRAFSLLNKPEIPCIIKNITDEELSKVGYMQMSENLKRDNLRFYEIAEFIKARVDDGELKDIIAKNLGILPNEVSFYMAWSKAPEWLKQYKNRFASIRPFYEYAQFAIKENEEALKEFMSNSDAEKFTSSMLKQLKGKVSEDEASSSSTVVHEVKDAAVLPSDDTGNKVDASNNNEESSSSFEADSVSDNSYTEDDQDFTSYDDSSDIYSEGKVFFNRPIILGFVKDREAELLYQVALNTNGVLLVRYEDGVEDQILAENFKIHSIIEG